MTRKQNSRTFDPGNGYDSNGQWRFDGAAIEALARKWGTPLYVYSAARVESQVDRLSSAFTKIKPLIAFAMKSNSNLAILSLLKRKGTGVDIVSGGELARSLKVGFPSKKIVFSGVGKRSEEIEAGLHAGKDGVLSFNCESIEEIQRIHAIAKKIRRKARVAFRFNPDVDAKTHEYISTGKDGDKFGMLHAEVLDVLRERKAFPWLDFHGVSVHIGSQLTNLDPLRLAFTKTRALWKEGSAIVEHDLPFLDVGGGLGVRYENESVIDPNDYAKLVESVFLSGENSPQTLVMEPGRWIIAEAGVLISKVEYRKHRGSADILVIDAGMNDLIRPALYEAKHSIVSSKRFAPAITKRSTDVVGPVCESSDVFLRGVQLPIELKEGDFVALQNAGAYGFSMASQYNSRARPAEVLIRDGKATLIRSRETHADLWRGEKR